MKFALDHDYHIHSHLSLCSNDPEQSNDAILTYAKAHRYRDICLTDHYWDEKIDGASAFYRPQNTPHIMEALPLPQDESVRFHFGCETDMDKHRRIGITPETMEKMDFIIIPTTHLHMSGFTIDECDFSLERRRVQYIERWEALLAADLPFHKVGIAHLTCRLVAKMPPEAHLELFRDISDATYRDLFRETAKRGAGVELNFPIEQYEGEAREIILRPYRIAKECGCRFYLGSDAHHPKELAGAFARFEEIVSALELTEDDRFCPFVR